MPYNPPLLLSPLPTPAVTQHWADAGQTPIEIGAQSATTYKNLGSSMPTQCADFRNVSDEVAADVTFSVTFTSSSGTALAAQQYDITGTFTPPVEIDNKCMNVSPGSVL